MSDSPPQGSDAPLKRQSASSSKFKPHLLAKVSNDLRRHSDGSVHTDSMQSHTKERLKILNRNSDASNGEKRRKNSRRKHNSNQRVSRRSPSRLHFIESPTATTTEQTTERPLLVSIMPLRTRSTRAPRLRASPASPATFKTKLEPIPEFTSLRPKQHWSNCLPDSILNSPSDDESSTHELTTKQIVFQRSASAPSIEPVATLTPDRDAKGRMRRRARPYFVSRRTFAKRPSSEPIVVGASSSSSSSSSSMWAATSSSSSRYSVPPLPDRTPGNAEHNAPLIDATVDALRCRRASDGGDVCLASPDRDIEFLDEIITAVKDNHDLPLLEPMPRQRSNSA